MKTYGLLLVALLAVSTSGCATSVMTSGHVAVSDQNRSIKISFNEHDRRLIYAYYAGQRKRMPPGLAKRGGNLPPGLAKRDVLPPGLQGRALPPDLEAKLTPLPSAYVRVRVGADLVLLERSTRVVLDVIYGVAT